LECEEFKSKPLITNVSLTLLFEVDSSRCAPPPDSMSPDEAGRISEQTAVYIGVGVAVGVVVVAIAVVVILVLASQTVRMKIFPWRYAQINKTARLEENNKL